MTNLETDQRVILIGGTSNVGKSTVAQALATKLGWDYVATDYLARHPGRPWKTPQKQEIPEHVVDHYLSLSLAELIEDVLRHYKRLWPQIESIITSHATDPTANRLVMEGSALWPESVATLKFDTVSAVWLTASDDLFQTRIYAASRYDTLIAHEQKLIETFLDRTKLYNERMMEAVNRLALSFIKVEATMSLEQLSDLCLELLHSQTKR